MTSQENGECAKYNSYQWNEYIKLQIITVPITIYYFQIYKLAAVWISLGYHMRVTRKVLSLIQKT